MKEKYTLLLIITTFLLVSLILFKSSKPLVKKEFTYNFSFPFFKEEKKEEYLSYKEKNNLSLKDAIIHVNIGLNNPFYTNVEPSKDINKITMLVNKYHCVDKNYTPINLIKVNNLLINKEAYDSFLNMKKDINKEGLDIRIISAYRSFEYQESLYNKYLKTDDKKIVDTYSARPGYSEHHTGLAIDIDNVKLDFNKFYLTKEFLWMNENAHNYGFILRYPKNKEYITGYSYEPWHYRYVGREIATYIKKHNSTYEEYYYEFLDL